MSSTNKLWRVTLDTNPEDCNLQCVMCEEHSPYSKFKEELFAKTGIRFRRMPLAMVEKIFAESKELGVKEIIPSTMGEPLLYQHIDRIYELAKESGIKINLTTNGTFPRKNIDEWARIIIPTTSDIKISWNGATAHMDKKIMIGSQYEKRLNNVRYLIAFRDEYFRNTGYYCRITFQLTFMRTNMIELADIVQLAASIGVDRVKGHHLWSHFEEIKAESMRFNSLTREEWNTYVYQAYEAQRLYKKPDGSDVLLENIVELDTADLHEVKEESNCPFLQKEIWISATGKISPCCAPDHLRATLGNFGNIDNQTISDAVSSSLYQSLAVEYKNREVCRICNMRK